MQNLELHSPIIDPQTGKPNEYFMRLFQTRGEDQEGRVPQTRLINTEGGLQGGGDLENDLTLSLTDTGVTPGTYTNATVTVDEKGRITAISSGGKTYYVPFGFTGTPDANEVMLLHTFASTVEFPDDWGGSEGNVGGNPTTTAYVFTIKKRTGAGVVTTVGTLTISTAGACAFVTTGTTVQFVPGDQIQVVGAGTANSTLLNASFIFVGQEQ